MSWDAYVDSLKQRGMVGGAICGLDGSWFVASDGSKVRNPIWSRWVCPFIYHSNNIYRKNDNTTINHLLPINFRSR